MEKTNRWKEELIALLRFFHLFICQKIESETDFLTSKHSIKYIFMNTQHKHKKEMCLSFRDYREWELNLRKREMSEPDPSTDCFFGSKTQDLRRIYSSDNVFYLFPTLYCNPIPCVTRFSKGKCFIVAGRLNWRLAGHWTVGVAVLAVGSTCMAAVKWIVFLWNVIELILNIEI